MKTATEQKACMDLNTCACAALRYCFGDGCMYFLFFYRYCRLTCFLPLSGFVLSSSFVSACIYVWCSYSLASCVLPLSHFLALFLLMFVYDTYT